MTRIGNGVESKYRTISVVNLGYPFILSCGSIDLVMIIVNEVFLEQWITK